MLHLFFPCSDGLQHKVNRHKCLAPVDGSWVAELEDAKAELAKVVGSPEASGAATAQRKRRGILLRLHMRLCRAYGMLRQWDGVEQEAEKGLGVCASYGVVPGRAGALILSQWNARFASFREQARHEMAVPCYLDMPRYMNIPRGTPMAVLPSMAAAVIHGDLRLMEDLVAHGDAIDAPVPMRHCATSRPTPPHS